jgi:hypothetical protein
VSNEDQWISGEELSTAGSSDEDEDGHDFTAKLKKRVRKKKEEMRGQHKHDFAAFRRESASQLLVHPPPEDARKDGSASVLVASDNNEHSLVRVDEAQELAGDDGSAFVPDWRPKKN